MRRLCGLLAGLTLLACTSDGEKVYHSRKAEHAHFEPAKSYAELDADLHDVKLPRSGNAMLLERYSLLRVAHLYGGLATMKAKDGSQLIADYAGRLFFVEHSGNSRKLLPKRNFDAFPTYAGFSAEKRVRIAKSHIDGIADRTGCHIAVTPGIQH